MVLGEDVFVKNNFYTWKTHQDPWKDKTILQTAITSCDAVYKEKPYEYLNKKEIKMLHNLRKIYLIGKWYDESESNFVRLMIAGDECNEGNTLYIAIKIRETVDKINLRFGEEEGSKSLEIKKMLTS